MKNRHYLTKHLFIHEQGRFFNGCRRQCKHKGKTVFRNWFMDGGRQAGNGKKKETQRPKKTQLARNLPPQGTQRKREAEWARKKREKIASVLRW